MTDSRYTPDPDDLLIQHVRQHSRGEPPASLDAFILATASIGLLAMCARLFWLEQSQAEAKPA